MKAFNSQDIYSASFKNQFTKTGTPTLNEDKKVYFITAVRGSSWSMNVKNSGEAYTRTGSGDTQFYTPILGDSITFSGTSEVSGFYVNY